MAGARALLEHAPDFARLRCMAERAVAGEDPYGCTPADWMPGFPTVPAGD